MADFNFTELRRDLIPSGTWGNVTAVSGSYTAATTEVTDDRIALCKLPGNAVVLAVVLNCGDLGASTLDIGFAPVDGVGTADPDAIVAGQADSQTNLLLTPVNAAATGDEDVYLIATVKTANITVGGTITALVLYRYDNYAA